MPVDLLDDDFNTGVQSSGYNSPLRRGETIDLSPADAARFGVSAGERVRVRSRRGAVEAPVRLDPLLKPGLAFMTFHFPDDVDVNVWTIDATDPKSGTAEFKAAAIRVEKLPVTHYAEFLRVIPGRSEATHEDALTRADVTGSL